jgi:exodeoxyribonuclease VII large subunit
LDFSKIAARHTPHALRSRIERSRERSETLAERAHRARVHVMRNARTRLDGLAQLLSAYSHKSVLDRGFALVRGADGMPVRSVGAAIPGAALEIEVADGRFGAVVSGTAPSAPKKAAPAPAKSTKQGSLF